MTKQLTDSLPLSLEEIAELNIAGVYSFSRAGRVEYIGRTGNFRNRHKDHCHASSGENKAAFAFRLARAQTNRLRPTYKTVGSRKSLMNDPVFLEAFIAAKREILKLEVRFVRTDDAKLQLLLELYASMELESAHNSFENT